MNADRFDMKAFKTHLISPEGEQILANERESLLLRVVSSRLYVVELWYHR